ncbi:helix-turn-helix domain-containing protein [Nocardia sp. NBC_01503]|uniref:helix-turn-helix domain-containing protein n=1 Tax=Nocardia sp. NBC_01503 TaxID=2975997 RepID=UPI002E7ACC3B|nr:helix-turn-helix transcriptional regulator [Nocardia sp. NBC_01503]WTL30862.1 helix-turn-helix domain-containing protein [Nocardia sp. NBC_01503]
MAAGSTVPRRLIGRTLKQLREQAGIPAVRAYKLIDVSAQTLWRIETGQPGPKIREIDVNALCRLYGADEDIVAALIGLVAETKSPGWWHNYGAAVPSHFDLYLGMEESARKLTTLHLNLLPGLLQTPGYRRAVIWAAYPSMATVEVEQRIEISAKRQQRLSEDPADFSVTMYVCESALRWAIGGPAVMAEQLRHIADLMGLPTVSIRVVPMGIATPLPLIVGTFTLMEFPMFANSRLTEPPLVYVEGYTGALYLDKPGEMEQYRAACKILRATALSEPETRRLVLSIAEEFE